MAFFRFAGLLALSLWLGGLATLGALTAPVLFDVLGAHDPASGALLEAYRAAGLQPVLSR